MTTQTIARCRSCDAEVVFVPSAKSGKAMILDAKPEKRVVLLPWEEVGSADWFSADDIPRFVSMGIREGTLLARVVDVYRDHHATCPNAADWKGRHR